MSVIIRATIANITREQFASAIVTACPWVNGTIVDSLGFGSWGVEKGITCEMAFGDGDSTRWQLVLESLADMLAMRHEECAYVTIAAAYGTMAYLLYPLAIGTPYRYELRQIL